MKGIRLMLLACGFMVSSYAAACDSCQMDHGEDGQTEEYRQEFKKDFMRAFSKVAKDISGVDVISIKYDYPMSGFYPVLIDLDGKKELVFFNGDYLIIGNVIPAKIEGEGYAKEMAKVLEEDIEKSLRFSVLTKKYSKLSKLKYHKDGNSENIITVFSDPFCQACMEFYDNTRGLVKDGKVEIHWISVAYRTPKSIDVASYLEKNGVDAWALWHNKSEDDKVVAEKEKIIKYVATEDEANQIKGATEFFGKELGGRGTPSIYIQENGMVNVIPGSVPAEILMEKIKKFKNAKQP